MGEEKHTLLIDMWSEVKSLSRVRLFAAPWTVAYQARVLERVAISFSSIRWENFVLNNRNSIQTGWNKEKN